MLSGKRGRAEMKVTIKKFDVAMEVKNKGVSLDVYAPDGEDRLGDLQVTKTGLTWCNGKKHTGPKKTWKEFIDWMNS
jgi:hypothetical protein